jgi:hypothetical protein
MVRFKHVLQYCIQSGMTGKADGRRKHPALELRTVVELKDSV